MRGEWNELPATPHDKRPELARYTLSELAVPVLSNQVVTRAVDRKEFVLSRNQRNRRFHLLDRPERVARAVNEERRPRQFRKVCGPQFTRLSRRVQRIGQQ